MCYVIWGFESFFQKLIKSTVDGISATVVTYWGLVDRFTNKIEIKTTWSLSRMFKRIVCWSPRDCNIHMSMIPYHWQYLSFVSNSCFINMIKARSLFFIAATSVTNANSFVCCILFEWSLKLKYRFIRLSPYRIRINLF